MIQLTEIAKFKGFPEKLRLICGSSHCSDHAVLTHNKNSSKKNAHHIPIGIIRSIKYIKGKVVPKDKARQTSILLQRWMNSKMT